MGTLAPNSKLVCFFFQNGIDFHVLLGFISTSQNRYSLQETTERVEASPFPHFMANIETVTKFGTSQVSVLSLQCLW
jgi:hypothetical protein